MPTEGTDEKFGSEAITDGEAVKALNEFFDTRLVDESVRMSFRAMGSQDYLCKQVRPFEPRPAHHC